MPFTKGHTINVGRKHTAVARKHYSLAKKGRKLSEETKKLISLHSSHHPNPNKGKTGVYSKETLLKMSLAKKGRKLPWMSAVHKGKKLSPEHRLKVIQTLNYGLDEAHPLWKGNNVGYFGLHQWVGRKLGRPTKCQHCGIDYKNKRYYWANISREYKRDLSDWVRLCASCHKRYDMEYAESVRYNNNSKV